MILGVVSCRICRGAEFQLAVGPEMDKASSVDYFDAGRGNGEGLVDVGGGTKTVECTGRGAANKKLTKLYCPSRKLSQDD